MLINDVPEIKKFKCKKILANYLIYKKGIPLLFIDDNFYYFVDNDKLRKILLCLPVWLKILKIF